MSPSDHRGFSGSSASEHGKPEPGSTAGRRSLSVLGQRATIEHFGTGWGDASPRHPDGKGRCVQAMRQLGYQQLVLPRLAFAHRLQGEADLRELADPLRTTSEQGDGFHLESSQLAVGIANADCAVGVLADEHGSLVVMHLGLACLYRSSGPFLLELAVRKLGEPESLGFWVGAGIGPCCHGYDDALPEHHARAEMLADLYGADVVSGQASRGPRRGQRAYDHVLMAMRLAEKLGIGEIEVDRACTACAGLSEVEWNSRQIYGSYFSNTRDTAGVGERNLVVVGGASK